MEVQVGHVHVAYTFLARSTPALHARSVPSDKIYASELSRKSVKGALFVGWACATTTFMAIFLLFPLWEREYCCATTFFGKR